jgi:hypothetical protein
MTNDIENVIDLFDELYVFETKEELAAKVNSEVVVQSVVNSSVELVEELQTATQEAEVVTDTMETTLSKEPVLATQPELTATKNESAIQKTLNYSGANKRHIAIIYNDIINDSRENVEMLSNLITKGLKFSMDDVAVVRMSKNQNFSIEEIITQLQAKHAIVWGTPNEFTYREMHQIFKVQSTQVMVADFVNNYHNKNDYKGQLWSAIQKLLSL